MRFDGNSGARQNYKSSHFDMAHREAPLFADQAYGKGIAKGLSLILAVFGRAA